MGGRWVDPDGVGQSKVSRRLFDEPFGMQVVGGVKHRLPFGNDLGSFSVVHIGRCQQIESGVMVLVVVPGEELLAESAAVLNGSEAVRVAGPILERFEVRF